MTHALALEVGSTGITVNVVAPGWVNLAHRHRQSLELQLRRHWDGLLSRTKWLTPWPFSHRMVRAINGATLVVDGGNILKEQKT